MKKILFTLSLVIAALSVNAQIVKGDMNDDKIIDVSDLNESIDVMGGRKPYQYIQAGDPYMVDNSLVAGTWYRTKSDFFTLNADGTTDYAGAASFAYLPVQSVLLFFDEAGTPVTKIDVEALADGRMEGVPMGASTLTVFTTTRPEQKVISITLNYKTLSMKVGEKADLTVVVLPTDADDRTVTFTSSNPEVATVVEGTRGRRSVQAVAPGSAYIYCRANDGGGASASIRVTVTE